MEIYPTIEIESIIRETEIMGDVIVVNKKNSSGDYLPNMYHLVRLNDESAATQESFYT